MTLQLSVAGSGEEVRFEPARLVIAGYTGRDQDAVGAHIAELAEIGIPAPVSVPAFYDLHPSLLTTDPAVAVAGANTSGEVEPVLLRAGGQWFLAVGSDHTDRDRERDDIAASKAACPKPIGPRVVRLPDDPRDIDLDQVQARSCVDGVVYQDAALSALMRPGDVLARMRDALPSHPLDAHADVALFGGTTPLLGGRFVPGHRWDLELRLPDGVELRHTYDARPTTTESAVAGTATSEGSRQ